MTITTKPGAQPADRAPETNFAIYEVDEYDTIRARGAREPKVNADLFPDIDPAHLNTTDDFVVAGENVHHLGTLFEAMLEEQLSDQQSEVEASRPTSARGRAARRELRRLQALHDKGWQLWVQSLDVGELERLRKQVADWWLVDIDWYDTDGLPMYCGPQGEALSAFEGLPFDCLEALGVDLVYGDHPGSSYFAAELKVDIDIANEAAERLGLDLRFVREGDVEIESPPPVPKESAVKHPADELQRRFIPLFGLLPDIGARVVIDPAQVRTIPPKQLQARHDRVLFQTSWDRIVKAIREPVRVWLDDQGGRHVYVLGIGTYSFDVDGVVSCHLWKLGIIGQATLAPCPVDTLSIDGVPWQWRWLDVWEAAFVLEVDHATRPLGSTAPDDSAKEYARWAFQVFRNRIRNGCDLRVMRHRISAALALDGPVLAVARQINMVERRVAVLASQYNQALRHGPAYSKLQHDGPTLMLAYALLSEVAGFPASGEPLQQMRGLLRGAGLPERCWRMLAQSTPALWRPMVAFYDTPGPKAALDYLWLLDELGWRQPADPAFMRTVLSLRGGPGGERGHYFGRFDKALPTLIRIVGWFERANSRGRREILADLHKVLSWLDYAGGAQLEPLVRKPRWVTLVKRAEAWWIRRLALQRMNGSKWAVPVERVRVGEYEVVFIARAEDLYDEARAMRHCVFDFVDECVKGNRLIASVRDLATGRRVATAMYQAAEPGWQLVQVVGFGNAVAPKVVHDAARRATAIASAIEEGDEQ